MGIWASCRRLLPEEWEQIQELITRLPGLDSVERHDAFAQIVPYELMQPSDRFLDFEIDWHALYRLITGEVEPPEDAGKAPPPLGSVIVGGTELPIEATYGFFRYLTPGEVRDASEALNATTLDDLRARIDPEAFTRAGVYSNGWEADELERVAEDRFPALVALFREAAGEGQVILQSFD